MGEMFTDIVEPSSFRVGPRRRRTPQFTLLAVGVAIFTLGSVEVGQILATTELPLTPHQLIAFFPTTPVADVQLPGPRPLAAPAAAPLTHALSLSPPSPITAPEGIAPERDATPAMASGLQIGEAIGIPERPANFDAKAPPPPARAPEPEAAPPVSREIPRVGDTLKPPTKINSVNPIYPPIAITARVEGTVIIEATINIEGRVVDAKILRSIPLLDAAALDAVRRWEYTPSYLNGRLTPVIMTITVHFTLR